MKLFKASLDNISKGLTIFSIAISLLIPLTVLIALLSKQSAPFTVLLVFVPLWVLITAMYLYRPLEYGFDDKVFFVRRLTGKYVIELSDIKDVRALSPEEMQLTIRTFGNGGLFGYTGFYYNRSLGKMRLFATRRSNYVLIETIRLKKIIVTPDDVEGFLKEFMKP